MKLRIAAVVALTAVALCAPCHISFAAGTAPGAPSAGISNPNWLGLTKDQQSRMAARLQRRNQDFTALRDDKSMSEQQKMIKARTIEQAYEADMESMLTPAQKARIALKRKQFLSSPQGKEMIARKAYADAHFKEIMTLRTKLVASLTPDEKQKIAALQASESKSMQSFQSDSGLSPTAKQAKMDALMKDSQAQMDAILTPEQRAEFDKMQSLYPAGPSNPPAPPAR